MSNYFSLNEICEKKDYILVDTCAFGGSLSSSFHEDSSLKEKLERTLITNKNISFWLDKIPRYEEIYSTNGVIDEIKNCKYKYKKSIKRPVFENQDTRTVLELRRSLSENKKSKFNLANMLESEGRIFKINENQKQIYNLFSEKYSFLVNRFNLSEVDFDLFILGGVISRENNISIISNDFGIRRAWKFFLKREVPSGKSFDFYSVYEINFFKRER